ncbi:MULTISPECIES: general secretion pathway protein GspJ [unclassified Bradyrhizobium]|nr:MULTISPECIES: general secretion pathway protein GspJ [unclassified Bradyrhizobium]WGR74544.1 general secretion pathway protein GspJ [Bradyrhizobium sp. ISRA426]WGR79379.1 general secretion pathway protein GspJ [Bradyrhizobium sp. ISRA430]WGR89716.1 general secretion pathway protein GspJ [Bradyrhizobium sp. ISRA432]
MLGLALRRIADDLSAAEFVPANREQKQPLFEGRELIVTFVRKAIGPNAGRGLDIVQIGEMANGRDLGLVRARTSFAPLLVGVSMSESLHLSDRVMLLASPFRLSFAYADRTLTWKPDWRDADRLPSAVRLTVHDNSRGGVPVMSTVAHIHVDAPAVGCDEGKNDCSESGQDQPKTPNVASSGAKD